MFYIQLNTCPSLVQVLILHYVYGSKVLWIIFWYYARRLLLYNVLQDLQFSFFPHSKK